MADEKKQKPEVESPPPATNYKIHLEVQRERSASPSQRTCSTSKFREPGMRECS